MTPWTVACKALLSMGFSRQGYWSGLPFPYPGESSWPRAQTPRSPAFQGDSLLTELPGKPGKFLCLLFLSGLTPYWLDQVRRDEGVSLPATPNAPPLPGLSCSQSGFSQSLSISTICAANCSLTVSFPLATPLSRCGWRLPPLCFAWGIWLCLTGCSR